jgi:hypothetical protein
MPESKFEKYIVRKPAIIKGISADKLIVEVPETDKIPSMNPVDTGPLVKFSNDFLKHATTKVGKQHSDNCIHPVSRPKKSSNK